MLHSIPNFPSLKLPWDCAQLVSFLRAEAVPVFLTCLFIHSFNHYLMSTYPVPDPSQCYGENNNHLPLHSRVYCSTAGLQVELKFHISPSGFQAEWVMNLGHIPLPAEIRRFQRTSQTMEGCLQLLPASHPLKFHWPEEVTGPNSIWMREGGIFHLGIERERTNIFWTTRNYTARVGGRHTGRDVQVCSFLWSRDREIVTGPVCGVEDVKDIL